MWDEKNLGSVEEEKQRYGAMQYRLKALQIECHIKKLQEQVEFYRYRRKRSKRMITNLKHWWVIRRSKKAAGKAEA